MSRFAFQHVPETSPGHTGDALYYYSCKLADAAISFSVRITLQPSAS